MVCRNPFSLGHNDTTPHLAGLCFFRGNLFVRLFFLLSGFFQDFFDALVRDSFSHKSLLVKRRLILKKRSGLIIVLSLLLLKVTLSLCEVQNATSLHPILFHYNVSQVEKRDLAQPLGI